MKKNFVLAYDLASKGKVVLLLGLRVDEFGMKQNVVCNKMEEKFGLPTEICYDNELLDETQIAWREMIENDLTFFVGTGKLVFVGCHNCRLSQLGNVISSVLESRDVTDVVIDNYDLLDGDKYKISGFTSEIWNKYGLQVHYEGKA